MGLPSAAMYDDGRKLAVVSSEKNIRLFLNTYVFAAEKRGNAIVAVLAKDVMSSRELRFIAPLFADCTGDGHVGFLAGADYRYGRESQAEAGEPSAPAAADRQTLRSTILWYAEDAGEAAPFPETAWALHITEETAQNATRGGAHWEAGCTRDQVAEFELIRDSLFRAIYGNWSFLKNQSRSKEEYKNLKLAGWVGCIGGKRESRRLLGDVVLREQDILNCVAYPDACVTATWCMDLHVPEPKNFKEFQGDSFRTIPNYIKMPPYAIPYRCLYSRNIENLFLAGRDISVTHVALGTARQQRTTGMMGEVVGMAAAIARSHNACPRDVYEEHLEELKEKMTRGVGKCAFAPAQNCVPKGYDLAWSDEFNGKSVDESKWEFRTDTEDWSTQQARNVAVAGGNLIITLNKTAPDGKDDYTGAAVLSRESYTYVPETAPGHYTGGGAVSKVSFGYGYYEFRARVMAGRGWRSSILMTAKHSTEGEASSEAGLELKVMENHSLDPLSYWVDALNWVGELESYGSKRISTDPLSDFHVYACEYAPGVVRYLFDGRLVQTVELTLNHEVSVNLWLRPPLLHQRVTQTWWTIPACRGIWMWTTCGATAEEPEPRGRSACGEPQRSGAPPLCSDQEKWDELLDGYLAQGIGLLWQNSLD